MAVRSSATLFMMAVALLANNLLFAAPNINNNAGTWTDLYNDNLGVSAVQQTVVDGASGIVKLVSGQTAGDFTTVRVKPTSFDAWGSLTLDGTWAAASDVTVTLLDATDTVIPGFNALPYTGPISLSSLSATTYPEIKVKVGLTKSTLAPVVTSLQATWNPISLLLLDKKAPATVQAGQVVSYRIRYSTSFVEARDLVVWDTLPNTASNTITYPASYGQNDNVTFVSATGGGVYTATALTVKGVSIPANSVYWDLGTKKEGTTDTLTFSVKTRNGTLNGTTVSNQALADAANAAAVTSQVVVTTVTALPAPLLEKRAGAGIYTVRGETLTRVNSENYFSIRAENSYTGEGRETMYDTVIYDKLTDLVGKIDPDLGGAGVPVKNISNGGTYVASYTPPAGGAAFPAVVWNVGTMEPGAVFTASFGVRLLDSPPLASTGQYINSAYIDSVRTRAPVRTLTPLQKDLLVKWPLHETPTGSFAKGDNLRGTFQIKAARDDDQFLNDLVPWSPTNPYLYVKPGGVLPFGLLVSNNGLSAMNDLVFLDKIPAGTTFKSAWFTDPWFQANAKVFYSTTDTANADTPPAYDYTAAPADLDASGNTYWENYATNPPSNVADVRWVAFYIPAVNSVFFDSSSPGWVSGAPQTGVAYYDVTVSSAFLDPDPCTDGFISNRALFRAYRYTPLNGGTPLTTTLSGQDDETTRVSIDKAILAVDGRGTVSTPVMTDPGNLTYTVKVKNTGEAIAGGVQVELRWPQTDVNGVLQYLPFVSVTPSAVTTFDPANGRVVVNMGNLAPGAISTAAITVLVPEGVSYGEQLTFNSTISAAPAACPIAPVIDQASAVAEMLPLLRVVKDDVLDLIPGASELDYTLTVYNEGDSPSHGTYVVDRVPAEMVFVRAYGPQGEQLLFSADDNLPPGYLTPSAPVSAATIATKFTPGILNNNGTPSDPSDDVWTSPFGEQTRWVAWQMDDASLTPPAFITGTARSVSFRVRNDLDGPGSGTAGSAVGTVIFNSGAVFSEELLQAIGNEVVTTINDSPAILVQKTGPSAVNTGVSFAWTIQYYNNSGTTDDVVSIVDTLPAGVTFQSATHTWNAAALANGAPPANNGLAVPSSVVSNPDGTTTVTFDIAGTTGYRGNGDDLAPSEGGTLVIQAQVNAGITSGANLLNHVSATATTGTDTSTSSDDHLVIVRNAELRMVKTSSQPNPIAGDEVTYNLVISNVSAIPAEGVVLTDVLSPDMTYVTGSFLVLTPGYTAGAPVLSSGSLSWSIANGNAITKSPLAAGTLPANSGNIVLQYRATVNAGVPAGTALPNTATVTTTTPEDGTYPNTDTETITTPHPDPAILKSGVAFTSPGDRFNWEIRYWNNLRQSANNVYVIDTLPDYNANGEADLTYVTSNAPAGVTAYFHAAASGSVPAFNPLSPTTGGWSAAPTTPVNHIAWLVGTLAGEAGPFTITVTTDAIAPNGGAPALLPAGVNLQNLASIHTTDTDQVPENSSDDHVTRTPGNDVSLTKTASAEGSTPGIAPGKPLTYTLRVENSGTQTAYGIEILDTLPTGVTLGSPEDNFLELALDENGTSTAPLDALGNPITGSVPVTRVVSGNTVRWYLGTNNASDTLYFRKVGLPSGAGQTFEVYVTINANVADSTTLVNSATVTLRNQSDTDPAEAVTTNNTDDSRVTVFLPDLTVSKSVKNVSDASEQWTEAGRVLEYTLEYDNAGNMTAQDVTLSEIIPAGTTFVPGSIVGAEDASNVVLQDFDQDGRIDAFDIQWASLPAPAFFAGEDLKCYGLSAASAVKISSTVGGFSGTLPNLGRFGNDVAVIGDVDADGVTDLAVGSYLYDGGAGAMGAVWIVFRNADGTVKGQSLITDNVGGMPASVILPGSQFGSGVTALGDFNGDGTPDIAVGSSGFNTEGALYVLFLKPDGTVDSYERISNNSGGINATWISTNDGLGTSLELVGDVNNDGAPDLIVGSPGYDGALGNEGNAFLLFMNPDRSGKALEYAKINGESMGVPSMANDALATSVTGIGDINADGVPDVAIGAVRDTTRGSAVYIVTLKNTGEPLATTVIDGTASVFEGKVARASRFGIGLSGGVDFNTDGIADLVVGAYGDDGAPTGTRPFAGAAYILFMNRDSSVAGMNKFSAATQTALSGLDSSDNFGIGLAAAQDLSGDGVPDIIGGAPQDDDGGSNRGAIWQLNLQTGSLPCTLNGTYVQAGQLYSPPANAEALDTPVKLAASHAAFAGLLEDNEEFGSSVSGIGDINNDGFQDIAIGSWKRAVAGVQVGAVYIVRMGAGRSVIGVNRITTGESGFTPTLLLNDRFGSAVAGLGDISGDGTHAIAVGSYNDDDGGANSNRGAVWIVYLNANGTVNRTQKISSTAGGFSGPLVNSDNFGWALAAVPDVDGDSVPELLSTAYGDDTGGADRGAVYLLRLNSNGTVKSHQKIAHGVGGFPIGQIDNGDRLGSGVAVVGDLDGDDVNDFVLGAEQDDDGASNRGAVYVCFMNSDGTVRAIQKISSTVGGFTGVLDASDFFGTAVTAAGDVNGDGVPDLVVGAKNDDDVPEGGSGSNRGAVWLLTLNANGTTQAWRKTSAATSSMSAELAVGDLYGQAVGSLGDLDGDGFIDIGAAASLNDTGGVNRGAVWIASLTPVGHYLTGTYEKLVNVDCLVGWRDLIVDQTVPDGTAIEWSILTADGSHVLFGPNNMSSGLISVGSIDPKNTEVLVRAVLTSESRLLSPQIHGWKLTYYACEKKQIKFRVTVDDPAPAGQTAVDNTVSISTSTPESSYTNNVADDSILLRLTDVEVTKTASRVSARPGDTVFFTLQWTVNGPQEALGVTVKDTLPAGFTFINSTPAQTSSDGQVFTWELGNQGASQTGTIIVETTVDSGTLPDTYTNVVRVTNDRQETDTTNNEDSVPVVVVALTDPLFANVWTSKSGPATAPLGGLLNYTITYGSNGGGDADNVVITDLLPAGLTFASAVPTPTSVSGQTVTWNMGTLADGATGSITLTAQVGTNYLTLHNQSVINYAAISTTSTEVSLADNADDHPVTLLGAPAAIGGRVWFDADADQTLDSTESGLANVLLTLTGTDVFGNPVTATQYTGSDGTYTFTGLTPGTYQIVETQPAGHKSTVDLLGTVASVARGTNSDPLDDQFTSITLNSGDRGENYNFGEVTPASVGDKVWIDHNGDGVQDATEPGIGGVLVFIDSDNDGIYDVGEPSATTTADGLYHIENLLPSTYTVMVDASTLPAGVTQTGDPDTTINHKTTVTLSHGQDLLTADFGYQGNASLGDYVWNDLDADGVQDATELPISGVVVFLDLDNDGIKDANEPADTTDSAGLYGFTGLIPGTYTVMVDSSTLPAGVTQTGDPDATADHKTSITLAAGDNTLTADFGYKGDASLGDYVWNDADGDGVQDATELPISGVVVFLDLDNDGIKDANEPADTTDSAGLYGFTGLIPGTYTVMVDASTLPAGVTQTGDPDASVDHKASITLAAGDNTLTADFGYQGNASLGDYVWNDFDADGVQDATELPISGVVVFLDLDNDGIKDANEPADTTDSAGLYSFTNLIPGTYTVMVDSSTLPAGVTQTGDPDATVDHKTSITLAAGDNTLTADFGYQGNASLGDYVWSDADADGVQDAAELALPNVRLFLDLDGDGSLDSNEPTQVTDSMGHYSFTGLIPGSYTVKVDASTLPLGAAQSADPDATLDNMTTLALAAGDDVLTADFGYQSPPYRLSGQVRLDSDGDGDLGDSDGGIAGVVIRLYNDPNGDGDPADGTLLAIAVTDASGHYDFSGLPAGSYVVTESNPANAVSSADVTGANDDRVSATITNADITGRDFLDKSIVLHAIRGTVLDDGTPDDGAFGAGDTPIAGAVIQLFKDLNTDGIAQSGELIATTATLLDGSYAFINLPDASDYLIIETNPAGFISENDVAGSATDDLITTSIAGADSTGNDFLDDTGVVHSISGTVRDDYDLDGSFSDNDQPVSGVTVTLYADINGNGVYDPQTDTRVGSTVTNSLGQYLFTGLGDGSYLVVETDPVASTSTADVQSANDNLIPVTLAGVDSSQNDFLDAVDPAGYIYSSVTGQIIGGGTITVTGPGGVTITQDGSSGQYSWITDGTPGTYTMTYAPPLGYIIDPTRPVTGASLDPTGQPDPYALGSSENALNPGYLTTSTAVGNPYYFTFDLASGDPFVINNNIPLVEVKPSSFAAWQYANPLGGQNGPNDDPDGDGVPNLAEFAFCYNPSSGIHRGCPFELEVQSGGSVNALLRRLQTSSGLTYTLQSLTDLSLSPGGWTDVTTLVPTLVSNGDGTQTATYTAVDALPALSSGQGFLRVKITDTASGASVVTDVSGFTKQLLGLGCVSSSMPYLPCPHATGSIDSVAGSTLVCSTSAGTGSYITALAAGKQHYIEITSGENEGHRYEIDEAATTATSLAIDLASALNTQATLPATLATDTWELRTHHTINELYPPAAFTSTNNPNTADRILIPNGAAFTTYWLYTNSGSPKWVLTSDATRVDQGGVILPPCAGYFVHPKTVQVSRTYAGRVRANDFICPLPIGSSMIASGWPLDQGPNSRAMTTIANAFVSSSSPTNADKILTWQGDSVSDATAYDTYAYLTTSSGGRWVKTQNAGLTDQGNTPFLKSLRAVFVKVTTAHPTWIMPLPWTP
ncbi:MAG: DUF11 domain-containing protein [Verrucomicrobiaceae bacterium]|nr:DUF11 domain-containing protein [Verrucomicrobiaceae bacterium]